MMWRRIPRAAVVLFGVFFCYLLFVQFFFVFHFTGGVARFFSRLIVIPAATVNGQHLSYGRLIELKRGTIAFHGPLDKKLAFERALSAGMWQLSMQDLADEFAIQVSKEELAAYPLEESQLMEELTAASWKVDDYRKYIVKPLLLAQKVEAAVIESDQYQSEARRTLEALIKKAEQGMPLAEVAERFSQDPSALFRGDLGAMSPEEIPEWLQPAVNLEVGQRSDILSAPEAYWYVEKTAEYGSPGSGSAMQFRGVAVRKRSLGTVLDDRRAEDPGWVFVW